jgi:hypothetical protein
MQTISISYALKWEVKNHPTYKVSTCGKVFNTKTNRQLRRCVNGGSVGYWLGRKFVRLQDLRKMLQKISNFEMPF